LEGESLLVDLFFVVTGKPRRRKQMEAEIKTVEVPEPEVKEEVQRPSVEEAMKAGWSEKEIESAKKRKMLVEPEEKTPETVKETAKVEEKAEEKKPEEKPKVNFLDEMDRELTPEQEKAFLELFPPGTKPRAFYFRAKNERSARQAVEAKNRELADKIKALESRPVEKKPILDENGDEIDPDDKPMTLRQLRELREKEQAEYDEQLAKQRERADRVTEAQLFQEEYAGSVLPDFKETLDKAKEVLLNYKTMFPEKWKQKRVETLLTELREKAARADELEVDGDTGAFVSYEIGRLHPDYGKTAEKKPDGKQESPKASGGLTPEQLKRAEINTQRRGSSAGIPSGSGRRTVTAEEVTRDDLNRMNYEERSKFKKGHPGEYAKLVRGD
jgi:hypothetical protein